MHCAECGTENLNTAKFCISCGASLREQKTPPPADRLDIDRTIAGETPRSFIARSLGGLSTVSEEEKERLIFRPGEIINNQYEVMGFVGAGGMGAVYRVKDRFTKEERALKVMLPSLVEDQKAVERFETEAKIAQKLVHDNIVRTYTIGEILKVGDSAGKTIGSRAVGVRFIVMEYVNGPSLRKYLMGEKEIRFEQAIDIAVKICQGLRHAHQTTVHRDVKPENILLEIDEENGIKVRLTDFGIARLLTTAQISSTGQRLGTAYYMAPEQLEGQEGVDQRADIYSVGAVLYELLTGEVPMGRFEDPSVINPDVPGGLDEIIGRCLSRRKEKRPASVKDLLESLQREIDNKKEQEAKRCRQEDERQKAENKSRQRAEEEARRKAEEEARQKEEKKKKAEEDARRKAEEETRRKSEESERLRKEYEEKKRREAEERRRKQEEEQLWKETERKRQDEERQRKRQAQSKKIFASVVAALVVVGIAIGIGVNKSRQARVEREQQRARVVTPTQPGPVVERPSVKQPTPTPTPKPASERVPSEYTNSVGMKFVLIKAGIFHMGSPGDEKGREKDETQHRVTITKDYYLQTTEVTQAQYEKIMQSNPSYFEGDNLPVESVSWNDAVEFCKKLSQKEGKEYRLPTEAEWEYACRAGTTTRYSFGDSDLQLGEYAWYNGNSGSRTHEVVQKKPNEWGIYDMHGNVWEWCSDWYGEYTKGDATDPTGPSSGSYRVVRGGSWNYFPVVVRSAVRFWLGPDYWLNFSGFRCARTP